MYPDRWRRTRREPSKDALRPDSSPTPPAPDGPTAERVLTGTDCGRAHDLPRQ
jgi:hypothetical protein